jgi:hypothetical protein
LFRRSGSFSCYLVEGSVPRPPGAEFLAALAEHRFASIETAASDQTSVGWVTAGDPTGESFQPEDIDFDSGFWLRARIDRKVLPARWVAIYRAAAEKSRGRALTRRERRELVEDLTEKLLPRVLPAVNLVDAVYTPDQGRLLLFTTAKGVRSEFETLFRRSFRGAQLLPADPHHLARHGGLSRQQQDCLEQVAPVSWLRRDPRERLRPVEAPPWTQDAADPELDAAEPR